MFCWYDVEFLEGNQKHSKPEQYLIDVLCPPLKLQDILSLVIFEPYCAHVDGALVFRFNSPGSPSSKFTFRLANKISENLVITVSSDRVPRLGFSPMECSNCKHLRGKISVLKATMNMHMLSEQHTVNSAALLHEVLNEMEKPDLE
nr:Mg2+ transporter protein, CorA-like/zinc transport protein ZntB [Tanacetum cinerariifolium]